MIAFLVSTDKEKPGNHSYVLFSRFVFTLTLHKTSNKNVLECVKCVCGHDFLARSVVHTT